LDFHYGFGSTQLECQTFVLAHQLGVLGRQRIDFGHLGTAPDSLQGLVGAGVTLPAPLGQGGGVKALPPQDRARAASPGVVDLHEDANLVRGRERAPAGKGQKFGRRRRWR
jgi:hypothetical protein